MEAQNRHILHVIRDVFGEYPIARFNEEVKDMINVKGTGARETKNINGYVLSVSEVVPDQYVEYKISTPDDPHALAITYLRNYPDSGPGGYSREYTSTWTVFGYVNDDEAERGILTAYKSYEQFNWANGALIATLPPGSPPEFSQSQSQSGVEPLSQDDIWDVRARVNRNGIRYGGRRRKTRHRRRKSHRRKTRRSRR